MNLEPFFSALSTSNRWFGFRPTGLAGWSLVAAWLFCATSLQASTLKAEYYFNGTLNSSTPGAPALTPIDPLGLNHFTNDLVNGQAQTVFNWIGNATPVIQQSGFALDPTGLVSPTNYSVEMVFKLTDRDSQWRRLIDVSNRQSDDGFYVDPGNHLAVYPIISSATPFVMNTYQHVVMSVGGGVVSAYLNGVLQFSGASALMNITSATNQLVFFADNVAAGGQGEFSNGSIASLRIYDGAYNPISLSIRRTNAANVVVSWASPATGFVLQQNPDLAATNWTTSPLVPSDDGLVKSVSVVASTGQMFYRLYHP